MKFPRLNKDLIALVDKTPPTRDRYVDFLRAFSIIVVVIGHWLSAVVIKNGNGIRVNNAVGMIPNLWIVTWILQVMPLFFFVGGFSNARTVNSLKNKGRPGPTFYRRRMVRLLRPTVVFLIIFIALIIFLILFFPDWGRYRMAIIATIGPLWFIGVYLFVTFLAPLTLKIHTKRRSLLPLTLLAATAIVDFVRFKSGISLIAWLNVPFIWLFVHQIGYFYEDGTLVNLHLRWKVATAAAGLSGLILLTNMGVYPKSMIGTGFEKLSNMNPPTICIIFLSIWLIGLAMSLREGVNRWLNNNRFWLLVVLVNRRIMTLYLWHLTAYAIVFLALYQFGLGHHTLDNVRLWWRERPIWVIMPGIILFFLIKIFGRFESAGMKEGG